MLDIGWGELVLIGVVALLVVGPKDLPRMFKTAGHYMGRARGMAREFQRSMEAAADDSGLKEAADNLKALDRLHLSSPTKSARKYAQNLVSGSNAPAASAPAGLRISPPASTQPAAATPASPPVTSTPSMAAADAVPEVKDPAGS